MLLITDRADVSDATHVSAHIVRLDDTHDVGNARHAVVCDAITCDVTLRSFADAERLRAALQRYRHDPAQPLTVLIPPGDMLSLALANALGATRVVSREAGAAAIYGAAPAPDPAATDAPPASNVVPLTSLVRTTAAALEQMFRSAHGPGRVDLGSLDEGADALILAVKENGISEFVDIVRGYDDATYQHCLLVAGLVTSFAARRGMSFKSQHLLAQAALVHDIGKARVPLAILNKAGPLSSSEMDVMRKHPSAGYYMIAHQSALDPMVLDIVRHHHEYLDGSGYPDRLRSEQISEFCRLVTICDIFAALMERRPYKAPMLPRDGYAILLDMGPRLDAGLVTEFGALVEEMDSLREAA